MNTAAQPKPRAAAVRILARSLFRELTSHGYGHRDVVGLATALLAEVTASMAGRGRPG